jgi:hypothetical protein
MKTTKEKLADPTVSEEAKQAAIQSREEVTGLSKEQQS